LTGSEEGFSERDLLRGDLLETGTGSFGGEPAPSGQVSAVRKRFQIEAGHFTAILVGKDGTVKHRTNTPVTPENLYALIDAMPMRRREMRERGGT